MSALHPCTSCGRHVRVTERACPFCSAVLSLAHVAARTTPTQRLGRAATFAFGAAVATSVAACSQATTLPDDAAGGDSALRDAAIGNDAGPDAHFNDAGTDAHFGTFDAGYGGAPHDAAPWIDAASNDAAVVFDPCADAGVFAAYGAAPPCDTGPASVDASMADDVWGAALYGAPPPPPEPQP